MPAPSGSDAGTASQLIPGVRRTMRRSATDDARLSRRRALRLARGGRTWRDQRAATLAGSGRAAALFAWRGSRSSLRLMRSPSGSRAARSSVHGGGLLAMLICEHATAGPVIQRRRSLADSPRCAGSCTARQCRASPGRARAAGIGSRHVSGAPERPEGARAERGAAEQGDEADEAFGGTVARMDMPPHARAGYGMDAGTASQLIPGVRPTLRNGRDDATGYGDHRRSDQTRLFPWVCVHSRPGRGGHSPPKASRTMAMSGLAEWKPNAIRVSRRMRVLTDSTRALLRPYCRVVTMVPR